MLPDSQVQAYIRFLQLCLATDGGIQNVTFVVLAIEGKNAFFVRYQLCVFLLCKTVHYLCFDYETQHLLNDADIQRISGFDFVIVTIFSNPRRKSSEANSIRSLYSSCYFRSFAGLTPSRVRVSELYPTLPSVYRRHVIPVSVPLTCKLDQCG